jgi:arsenate reductase
LKKLQKKLRSFVREFKHTAHANTVALGGTRMTAITLYHNPDCSKSRAALALLEENDAQITIVYYLEEPLERSELENLLGQLGLPLRDLLRKSEDEYEQFALGDETLSEDIVYELVLKHPILIQRPIAVAGNRALIARPPERVLELI